MSRKCLQFQRQLLRFSATFALISALLQARAAMQLDIIRNIALRLRGRHAPQLARVLVLRRRTARPITIEEPRDV
jgi:hypothetical protein